MGEEIKVGEHVRVPVEKIEPMPIRLRVMDAIRRNALKRSLREVGYVEFIQVVYYSDRDKYRIVNGQHRYEALIEAGAKEIDVIVIGKDLSEEEYLTEALRLNNIHGDYDPVALANVIGRLRKHYGNMLEPEFAEKLGFTPTSAVFKRAVKKLVKELPEEARKKVEEKVKKEGMTKSIDAIISRLGIDEHRRAILFSHGSMDFFIIWLKEDEWAKLMAAKKKIGSELLAEVIVKSICRAVEDETPS